MESATDYFERKKLLPTEFRTREFARLPLWVREQSFFMATVLREDVLASYREAAAAVVRGEMNLAAATRIIREGLERSGYKPEPGQEGTIKDLSSWHRMMVTLKTNERLANGWMQDQLMRRASKSHPAKRLTRFAAVEEPRLWTEKLWPEAIGPSGSGARADEMVALLDDPIWTFLSDFGTPHAPLKWGSQMDFRPVGFRETKALGLLRPSAQPKRQPDPQNVPATVPPSEVWQPGKGIPTPLNPFPRPIQLPEPLPPQPPEIRRQPVSPNSMPPAAPGPSLNSTLEVSTGIRTDEDKRRVEEELGGLGIFINDKLVFTDPNGTRPLPLNVLAGLFQLPNVDGTENYQKRALREWIALGGNSAAIDAMREQFSGTDLLDDFNRLMQRLRPLGIVIASMRILWELVK